MNGFHGLRCLLSVVFASAMAVVAAGPLPSGGIGHPVAVARQAAWATKRDKGLDELKKLTAPAMALQEGGISSAVRSKEKNIVNVRNPWEESCFYLGLAWRETKDDAYAQRCVALLDALAGCYNYGGAPQEDFFTGSRMLPYHAVLAYDLVYDSGAWGGRFGGDGQAGRERVEKWFRAAFQKLAAYYAEHTHRGNLTPYSLRHSASMGMVLNDWGMLDWTAGIMGEMLTSRDYFHIDGVWQEGTHSYFSQTVGNLWDALVVLDAAWQRRSGAGLGEMGHLTPGNLAAFRKELDWSRAALATLRFPDGRPAPIGDTDIWTAPSAPVEAPNIELHDYGHFSLTAGKGDALTQVHLQFPPLCGGGRYSGGHYHDDRLSMLLWAAGTDILPDNGYARTPANNRYFHCSAWVHNMATAMPAKFEKPDMKGRYGTWMGAWARTAFELYDGGVESGGRVQAIEASTKGLPEEGVRMERRTLVLISPDGARPYVVDLFRLQGGAVHESFLHQADREDAGLDVSLAFLETGKSLEGVLGDAAGLQPQYRKLCREARVARSGEAFNLTWTGVDTGASVRVFVNGMAGGLNCLSRIPRLYPTKGDPKVKDDFPGWHLYRRRDVSPEDVTLFGAVYDAWKKGGAASIRSVEWLVPQGASPECVAVRVVREGGEDLVFFGGDGTVREVGGVRVGGRLGVVSRGSGGGGWVWLSGAGKAEADGHALEGRGDVGGVLRAVHRAEGGGFNAVDVDASVSGDGDFVGRWLRVVHGDGSATGYGVDRAEALPGGGVRFFLRQDPGFEMTGGGMRRVYFPKVAIGGAQRVEALRSSFIRWDAK